jgi:GDPmannose 4,6-dehydratase
MWLMMQQKSPGDYVIATNENHTIKEFCEEAFLQAGIELIWEGNGVQEKGIIGRISKAPPVEQTEQNHCVRNELSEGQIVIEVDPAYYRPTEVETLLGDYSKAKKELGWEPKVRFNELVQIMVEYDYKKAKYERYKRGYKE